MTAYLSILSSIRFLTLFTAIHPASPLHTGSFVWNPAANGLQLGTLLKVDLYVEGEHADGTYSLFRSPRTLVMVTGTARYGHLGRLAKFRSALDKASAIARNPRKVNSLLALLLY